MNLQTREKRIYPLDTMLAGESFTVAYSRGKYNSLRNCVEFYTEKHGGVFTVIARKNDNKITVTKISNKEDESKLIAD